MNLLTQIARAFGIHSTHTPPFGDVFADAANDQDARGAPTIPFMRSPFSRNYSEELKNAVWEKGQPMIGWDPGDWRVDHRGNPLFRAHYDDKSSSFGWEVAHIVDRSVGGSDDLSNLRPQQCSEIPPGARIGELIDTSPFSGSRN